jgi:hypothetical protein
MYCHNCKEEYTDIDHVEGYCLNCHEPIIEQTILVIPDIDFETGKG